MRKKDYKIDIEIYIVFLVVIGITVFNAIYSSLNITKNREETSQIVNVDIPTIQQLQNMNLLVTRSEMYTTNWVYLPGSKEDKDSLRKIHAELYPLLKGEITILMMQWNDKRSVDSMQVIFQEFGKLISWEKKVTEQLRNFDDYEDATKKFTAGEMIESEILPRSSKIIAGLDHLIRIKKEQAGNENTLMMSSYKSLLWSVSGIAILIIIAVLISVLYLSNSIIVPLMRLKSFVVQMGKGEVPEIKLQAGHGVVGQMTTAIKDLTYAMKQTANFAQEIGEGNFNVQFKPLSEHDEFGNALLHMRDSLQKAEQETRFRSWTGNGLARIGEVLRENTDDIEKLSESIIHELVKFFDVNQGGIFIIRKDKLGKEYIQLTGSYALDSAYKESPTIKMGDGLIGQCIRDGEIKNLNNVPNHYFNISSGLGSANASNILIVPLRNNDHVYGAIELASFRQFKDEEVRFVEKIGDAMASSIASSLANSVTRQLLEETQKQATQLVSQEDELLRTNEELSKQSIRLQASEKDLKQRNDDLRETAQLMKEKNDAMEMAREALSIKAKELELNNRFKSEFLANMSHEFRTPLNSVLILARLLSENKNKSLSEKEIEYARVIYKSGNDLLILINDILDLSKIEAGKLEMHFEETDLRLLTKDVELMFRELANEKNIDFSIEFDNTIPGKINTDRMRLEQVIKNLLSNAFKFTRKQEGFVRFSISPAKKGTALSNNNLLQSRHVIGVSVSDNGIGIAADKQKLIFEAFKQADGSTSRKFGGTGLGLSISKELAQMLGGEIQVESKEGEGSTFTIYIPSEGNGKSESNENDKAEIIRPLPALVRHTESLLAGKRQETAIELSEGRYNVSARDNTILIIEDDPMQFEMINNLIQLKEKSSNCIHAGEALEAYSLLAENEFDCIILDLNLGNDSISGYRFLEKIKSDNKLSKIPVIIYTGSEINEEQKVQLEKYSSSVIIKSRESLDTLIKETISFLQKVENKPGKPASPSGNLRGRCVLLVDDDMRNIYAISGILEGEGMKVIVANDGKECLDKLAQHKDVDLVLMDIMMPEMDGFTAMKEIRKISIYKDLPVIALTAKAMDGDREKCINAGATGYIAKPVNVDQLLSIMKTYLYNEA